MSRVYLVNVGANTRHSGRARSPLFPDGSFKYVPFPQPGELSRPCNAEAAKYFRDEIYAQETHDDPDWQNLTYGDNCRNGRAAALRRAEVGNVLLFWALLWEHCGCGAGWEGFTREHGWYFIGALRIEKIVEPGQCPQDDRAARCVHFEPGQPLGKDHRVFVGSERHSALFEKAVDLEVRRKDGLIYEIARTAGGRRLNLTGKGSWRSSLRGCRAHWNLDAPEQRSRAETGAQAIRDVAGYDLFAPDA
ncbi:MAG TPA: hypothetical protein VF121_15775 [Thermoanaerobaculia bacterium]|nr:hypothetical protein [Thermoanaerobaculia bacterium]